MIVRAVSRDWSLRAANAVYNRLGTATHERLQSRFAKIFREREAQSDKRRTWTIRFAGSDIVLPLSPQRMWLDWDAALSTNGHEISVKQTYATLLSAPDRPDLFLDVGANYGTHSLLFLAHGVTTVSFEPNASCHAYFQEICSLNGVSPRLEKVAVGETNGTAELCFPEGETWLGSIDVGTVSRLEHEMTLVRTQVPVRPLDDYLDLALGKRVLLKIDAEGHEVAILRGAAELLKRVRPRVLFESWADEAEKRRELLALFSSSGYRLARLPLMPGIPPRFIGRDAFLVEPNGDFIAIPE